MTAEAFNRLFPIGTPVNYHPLIGETEHTKTKTRSEAWTLDHGAAVVQIEGKSGSVSLDAISVDPEIEKEILCQKVTS